MLQTTHFPECLEDWIGEDNLVRVVDLFVDELDLAALGFHRHAAARTGRPGYHPAVLLKLFIYGYLNRIPSSRRLEREAGRNVEVMWLSIYEVSPATCPNTLRHPPRYAAFSGPITHFQP